MPRVMIAGPIHPSGVAALRAAGDVAVDLCDDPASEAFARHLAEAEAVLLRTQPLTATLIEQAPRLRMVSRHGVGYDSVDVAALNARHIPLAVVGDVNALAVAEHAIAMMLALAKRLREHDTAVREGRWAYRDQLAAGELYGKTLLILGFGRIGRRLARLAAAFEMRVLAHDPYQPAELFAEAGATPATDLAAALAEADYVSVHVPKAPDAPAVLGEAELARLKPSAVVINTARGGVVDERALAARLSDGRLAAAGLDVFVPEPPPVDHPLLGLPNVLLSPHNAGLSAESAERMAMAAAHNIIDFFQDRLDPRLVVNRAALDPA